MLEAVRVKGEGLGKKTQEMKGKTRETYVPAFEGSHHDSPSTGPLDTIYEQAVFVVVRCICWRY